MKRIGNSNGGRPRGAAPAVLFAVVFAFALSVFAQTEISTFDDLNTVVRANPDNGNFLLVNSIIIPDGTDFVPIGTYDKPFNGKFHGRADVHGNVPVIRNLKIKRADSSDVNWAVGLFGVLGVNGEVKNVAVAADTVIGYYAAGVLVGINDGVIDGCYASGRLVAASRVAKVADNSAGGLVGINSGVISRSFSEANVGEAVDNASVNAGGLVGLLTRAAGRKVDSSGVISNSYATGHVRGVNRVGGLVGYIFGGKVDKCFSVGRVEDATAAGGKAGGLIGVDFGDIMSWNVQGVNSGVYVDKAVVLSSFWNKETSGQNRSAGEGPSAGRDGIGAKGVTTQDMRDSKIFKDIGWDFKDIWDIPDGADHPQLKEITPKASLVYVAGIGGRLMVSDSAESRTRFVFDLGPGIRGPFVAVLPEKGYRFDGWDKNGVKDLTTGMIRRDAGADTAVTYTASFKSNGVVARQLSVIEDLEKIGKDPGYPINGVYELKNDINAGGKDGKEITPIGSHSAPFTGVFMGNGKKILYLRIKGGGDAVGLFGYADGASITDVYVNTIDTVKGINGVGVLLGRGINVYMENCGAAGDARSGSGDGVGGLVGSCSGSVVIRGYSLSSASGAKNGAGGLIGVSTHTLISHSYATWNIEGENSVGGLTGLSDSSAIQFSYAVGHAEGANGVGGLVGRATGAGKVYQCYSSGQVVGAGPKANIGGFAGIIETGGTASASFWNVEESGQTLSSGGNSVSGISTNSMMNKNYFESAGWDFAAVWNISSGSYPYIRGTGLVGGRLPGPTLKSRQTASAKPKQFAHVNGRTMTIKANPGIVTQIRLIDTRGKTVCKYDVRGNARVSLARLPSGRYVVEAREGNRRVNVAGIVVGVEYFRPRR